MFEFNNKDYENYASGVVLLSLLLTFNKFRTLFYVVSFDQVSADWVVAN